MATVNGIALKSLKTFNGMEGSGFSASIYMDGKKIGEVIDSAYGGCYDYRLEKGMDKLLSQRIKEYFQKHPTVDWLKVYEMSLEEYKQKKENLPKENVEDMLEMEDCFISELVDLTLLEKEYKKQLKNGYNIFVSLKAYHVKGVPVPLDTSFCCTERYDYKQDIEKFVEKNPTAYATVYQSLEDFNVV